MPRRLLCLGALYAVLVVLAVGLGQSAAEVSRVVFGLIGLAAAAWAARERGPARRAWLAVAVSFAVLVVSPLLLFALKGVGVAAADEVTHVTFVLALLAALRMFPLARMNRRERWKSAIDATTVLVGGTMVLWYTSFGGHAERNLLISAGLFPLSDLALLFVASRVL